MKKKILNSLIAFLSVPCLFLTGCSNSNNKNNQTDIAQANLASSENKEETNMKINQTKMPQTNEEIAVIYTNSGQIKLRFFPQEAPKAVENFKTHAKEGYYNGLTFHRVIKDFMIQGGDPNGNGTGGQSIWKKPFEDEFSSNLVNINGAVAMANSGPNTNGSQFFINQASKEKFEGWDYYETLYNKYKENSNIPVFDTSKLTDYVKNLYLENGGNPYLDGYFNTLKRGHTVFAQVFEGLDIVNKIANVEVDENDKPKKAIKIEKIEIINYK